MPTSTYIALAETTLGASATDITISSIPSGYRDLVIVLAAKNTGAGYDNVRVQFNADTGSNYSGVQVYFNGSSYASNSYSTDHFEGLTSSHSHNSAGILQVLDYSATDKHKVCLIRGNTATSENGNRMAATRWASTSAVTSIKLYNQSTNFDTGTTVSVFGIAS